LAAGLQQLQADKARLEGRLQEAQEQLRQARQQHEVEMQVRQRTC
jgi:predicted Zn-dependent protease